MKAQVCAAIKNWKTTASGVLGGLSAFVALFPDEAKHYPRIQHVCAVFAAGGLAYLGISAKDSHTNAACDLPKETSDAGTGQ